MRPGPRDHLITESLEDELAEVEPGLIEEESLDPVEAPSRLARHAMGEIQRHLDDDKADDQARRVNDLISNLDSDSGGVDSIALPARVLKGIRGLSPLGAPLDLAPVPAVPFSQSDLLINAEGQPSIGSELRAELASADSVDLICAFVIWSGVRHLKDVLKGVVDRGGRVRIITTTYMGATEKRAVDELHSIGAEIKVALDARTTKLHAKAWLLERESGLSTAFVGSSNLSHTALFDGLEWNVRLSSVDALHVIERVRMTFESHWADSHFDAYDPALNGDDLNEALNEHNRRSLGESSTISFANLDVRPCPHQQRMLDALTVERERHDRHRNLIVAATGTGKTVVAALDYKQLCEREDRRPSLLFVAHRTQILEQSLATYRAVLHDGSFGAINGDGKVATGEHVFSMIQSLKPDQISPDQFEVIVVDEFHHAKAKSYDELLSAVEPVELLGLTATPERMDGRDVTEWFDRRIAVELRLWEAIDQGFLVPFQYFGIADGTDLRNVTWRRGGYVLEDLSNLYSADDKRAGKLLDAIKRIVLDPGRMRALGFCVSKEHAHFMARKFSEAGLKSVALTADDPSDVRRARLSELQRGDLRCIFSVEVLGEGVDVPDVDCVLLLRPTQSPTLFSQQIGRGLRRAKAKSHLTIIDMIGQHRSEFRFDERLKALVDPRRGPIDRQVEAGFPFLPSGATIQLDRQSDEIVLDNLRAAVRRSRWSTLADDLSGLREPLSLDQFLDDCDHRIEDVYRGGHNWTELKRAAGKATTNAVNESLETSLLKSVGRLTHIDDPERVAFYAEVLGGGSAPKLASFDARQRRLLTMLAWGLNAGASGADGLDEFFAMAWNERSGISELGELLATLDRRAVTGPKPSRLSAEIPLLTHARYSSQEVLAALGAGDGVKPPPMREGVKWVEGAASDAFLITLHKAEREYSPSTMYRDYAISPELFHWESQSQQASHQPTVQRYINHEQRNTNILLFARERKSWELGTRPFVFLGPATYVSHKGERPVAFTWRLSQPMPQGLFEVARGVAAA